MGEDTEGTFGAFRKGGGTLEAGRTWYAAGSRMKEKSFGGMSEIALGAPSCGEMGDASDRVGDNTRWALP